MSNSPWKEDKKLDAILKLDQTAKLCQKPSQHIWPDKMQQSPFKIKTVFIVFLEQTQNNGNLTEEILSITTGSDRGSCAICYASIILSLAVV